MLRRSATVLTRWSTRWVPDAWVIAIVLSIIIFLIAFFFTPGAISLGKIQTIVEGWGGGFWALLEFAMQMSLIILTGYVVATSPPFRRMLERIAAIPKSPKGAIAVMALTSMVLVLLNWGLGLVAAANLVRYMARRHRDVDYRLLVAAAYLGMSGTWHGGLSASAPLLVATPGNFSEQYFGLIGVGETIFHPFNILLVLIVIALWTVLAPMLHPREQETFKVPVPVAGGEAAVAEREEFTPAKRLERSPIINMIVAIAGITFLIIYLGGLEGGVLAGITLDTVNFVFLMIGILLHWRPSSLLQAAEEGGTYIWGVVLQFPFYAGMLGMITASGLDKQLADLFTSATSANTFPLGVYWYSGILNYFVPSGGSKFAIEAPYIADAAKNLGVPLNLTVVAYAWGDMATDAIQPFWAIPLLAIAKLGFRDIMGFLIVLFVVYAVLTTAAFLIAPVFF